MKRSATGLILFFITLVGLGASCASPVPTSSSPPVSGSAHLGDEPAAGVLVQLSFSQTNKDCVSTDPSTTTDDKGSFRFARGVGEELPRRVPIAGVWRLCFSGPEIERRSFSWPWIGDPATGYATMRCDLASPKEKPCAGTWLSE